MGNDYVLVRGPDIYRLCEKVWGDWSELFGDREPPPKVFFEEVVQVFNNRNLDKSCVEVYRLFLRLCFEWFGYTDTVVELLNDIDEEFLSMDLGLDKTMLDVAKGREDKRYAKEKMYWFNLCSILEEYFQQSGADNKEECHRIGREVAKEVCPHLEVSDTSTMVNRLIDIWNKEGRISYEPKDLL